MSEQETEIVDAKERSKRAILHVAELWVAMAKSDAGVQFQAELRNQIAKQERWLKEMVLPMGGNVDGGAPVDQRQVDFGRGVIEGLSRTLQILKTAEEMLAKLDKAPVETEQVEEVDVW